MKLNLSHYLASQAGIPVGVMQITMTVILISMIVTLISVDVFAFENGAVATASQTVLRLFRWCWPTTYLVAAFCGGLLLHLSVPRIPNQPDPPYTWIRYAAMWTPALWAGIYVAFRFLRQLPNVD